MWLQGRDRVPTDYIPLMESWRNVNPSYRYLFWDENSIDGLLCERFSHYVEQWRKLTPAIKRCDAARCFILYEFGGIYADLDTQAYRSIDSLISNLELDDYDIVLSEESKSATSWKGRLTKSVSNDFIGRKIVSNAIMMSRKRDPFWLEFLNESFRISSNQVLESFSTWHLTKFLDKRRALSKIAVISPKYLLSEADAASAYATHRYDGTWLDNSKAHPWEV